MNIKKLLAVALLMLGVFVGGVVQAQTNYSFSTSDDTAGAYNFSWVATVDSATGQLQDISNLKLNGTALTVQGLATYGASSITNASTYAFSFDFIGPPGSSPFNVLSQAAIQSSGNSSIYNLPPGYWDSYSTVNATPGSSGAPEIDGSLAPKVGFLLGCLFLMFGRKKQNSESMMTA
jgi:hypothetical protein